MSPCCSSKVIQLSWSLTCQVVLKNVANAMFLASLFTVASEMGAVFTCTCAYTKGGTKYWYVSILLFWLRYNYWVAGNKYEYLNLKKSRARAASLTYQCHYSTMPRGDTHDMNVGNVNRSQLTEEVYRGIMMHSGKNNLKLKDGSATQSRVRTDFGLYNITQHFIHVSIMH